MDPMSRKLYRTNAEVERHERLSEAARLMSRLGFVLDKTRTFDQFLYRLRRKRCMKIVWHRRSPNEDTLLADMLKWLRKKAENLDAKDKNTPTEDKAGTPTLGRPAIPTEGRPATPTDGKAI